MTAPILDDDLLEKLAQRAREYGTTPAALLRQWLAVAPAAPVAPPAAVVASPMAPIAPPAVQALSTLSHVVTEALDSLNLSLLMADATRPDMPVVYVNPAFERLTGYSAAEVVGRNCRFMQRDDHDQPGLHELRAAIRQQRPCLVRLRNYRKDGTLFWNELHLVPITDEQQRLLYYAGMQHDITRYRHDELHVARQARLFQEGPVVVLEWGYLSPEIPLREKYVSPTVSQFGYTPHDFLSGQRAWIDIIHADDRPRIIQEMQAALAARQESLEQHYRLHCADGSVRWIYDHTILMYDDPEEVARGYLLDVTSIKTLETARQEKETLLAGVLESSLSGKLVLGAVRADDGRIVDFEWLLLNQVACAIFRRPMSDYLGRRMLDIYPADRTNGIFDLYAQVVETGIPATREMYFPQPAPPSWIVLSVVRLNDSVVVSFNDITDRKLAEEALRRSNARYDDLARRIPAMVFQLRHKADYTFQFDYISPRVQDWHHLTADQVTQDVRCLTAQIAAADARPVYLALRESARTGQPFLWEGRFKTPGGQRWMRWEGQPDPQPDGSTLWSGIAIDITPQKETEIALQLAQKAVHDQQHLEALLQQEQRLSTLQNRLLRTISHEFRTPLTIIQNAADLIERYTYRLSMEDRHRKLEIIRGQIRHLSGLLDEMMDSVRLTFQHSDFQPAPMNLEQLCRASVNEIAGTIGAGHHLVLESSGDTGAVALDERLISRILLNLLSNAVKYSPAGSTIRLWLEARPAEVVLRVSDEGIGMSTDDQAHLFEPFYRSPVVAGIPGTGLGLNIVQECVLRHNGRIEVHSVPQQGTTFIIHLPVGQPARA